MNVTMSRLVLLCLLLFAIRGNVSQNLRADTKEAPFIKTSSNVNHISAEKSDQLQNSVTNSTTSSRSMTRRLLNLAAKDPSELSEDTIKELQELVDITRRLAADDNSHGKKTWKDYEVVDGLKNEDVAVFLLSTSMKGGEFIWTR